MPAEGKIKSKDLQYESALPPFLQRLHAQKAGLGDQDRHERPVARPKRSKAHDEEDEPTVVDESGETVSKDELTKLREQADDDAEENVKGQSIDANAEPPMASGAIQDDEQRMPKQIVSDGTATKKRKVAKVVGEDDDDSKAAGDEAQDAEESTTRKVAKKGKRKSKPIKLAFANDEDGAT